MMYDFTKLDQHVKEMINMAVKLLKYPSDDEDISLFKQREIIVDGYFLVVYFSRYDYKQNGYLDVVSISGKYMPFLPISVLCKIAKKFLGDKELSFFDLLKDGRKFYSWTVLHKEDGTPVTNSLVAQYGTFSSYNGLDFVQCHKSSIDDII